MCSSTWFHIEVLHSGWMYHVHELCILYHGTVYHVQDVLRLQFLNITVHYIIKFLAFIIHLKNEHVHTI